MPSSRATRWAAKLAARVNPADAERIAARLMSTIDDVSADRWDAAVRRAAELPGSIRPEKVQALARRRRSGCGRSCGGARCGDGGDAGGHDGRARLVHRSCG
jgi:hypothetical protein